MLPKENALPGTQRHATVAYGNAHVRGRKYAAHVCWHIVRTFGIVTIERIAVRHEAEHEGFEIAQNIPVRVLGDQQ